MIKVNIINNGTDKYFGPPDRMYLKGHNIMFLVFFPEMQTGSNHKLIPHKPKLRDILWNKWPLLFKSVKSIKDKENEELYQIKGEETVPG